ncbi:hypothetical protein L1987_13036 [Smallanthus sonchifolius]|uniref:Uncharacterized protein n=1 Tax=Smallanthus sonchifolius TaxID=185202 RepID=A0ACB9JHP9_9ASTR|nr:hypothetical protein L1987_13036 [Smallanthus sonchifolius]
MTLQPVPPSVTFKGKGHGELQIDFMYYANMDGENKYKCCREKRKSDMSWRLAACPVSLLILKLAHVVSKHFKQKIRVFIPTRLASLARCTDLCRFRLEDPWYYSDYGPRLEDPWCYSDYGPRLEDPWCYSDYGSTMVRGLKTQISVVRRLLVVLQWLKREMKRRWWRQM